MDTPVTERRSDLPDLSGPSSGCLRLYAAVLLGFAVVFAATAQRGVAWQDSGVFQVRILRFDLAGERGLALAHPLLIVLGKAFSYLPLGPQAWRINLLSVICVAVAAANLAALVRRLVPGVRPAAWIAAGFFALAHTPWWLATICESQALLAALLTTELHVLVRVVRRPRLWQVFVLALLNGLALSAHNLALLALPAYVVAVAVLCRRKRLRWRAALYFAGGWVLGASMFLTLVLRAAGRIGWGAAVHSALFGQGWQRDVLGLAPRVALRGIGYVLYNFPNLALPLAAAGVWRLRRSVGAGLACGVGYLTLAYLLFAVRYAVPDQFMFFLPFYALVALLAGLGLGSLRGRGQRRWLPAAAGVSLVIGPALYAFAPAVWKGLNLSLPGRKGLPFRDPWRYWLTPWKGAERSAEHFARRALEEVPAGSVIVADGTSHPPLIWTQQVHRLREDVRVLRVGEADPAGLATGSPDVFVVSNLPDYHPEWFDRTARLYREEGKILIRVDWGADSRP